MNGHFHIYYYSALARTCLRLRVSCKVIVLSRDVNASQIRKTSKDKEF